MFRALLSSVAVFGLFHASFGSHLCGADISYSHLTGLTYQIEVRLYTDSDAPPEVLEMVLSYGDGFMDTIPALSEITLGSDCCDQVRTYVGEHTYASPGVYVPGVIVPNRVAGIANVPLSNTKPICVDAMLLVDPGFTNSSPEFLNHAVFTYFNGNILTHELQPYDSDGDSLSFELLVARGQDCAPIPGYQFPNDLMSDPDTILISEEGIVQWDAPQWSGLFVLAVRCVEWRDGVMIGAVTRDMMFCVSPLLTSVPALDEPLGDVVQNSIDGVVSVRINSPATVTIDIFDLSGARVRQERSSDARVIIRTDGMTPGIYLLRCTGRNGAALAGRFSVTP